MEQATAVQLTEGASVSRIGRASYDPADNKLRLRPNARLPRELYERVKAAGFAWAPRQELFVAGMWTPERESLLIELCGELEDEDTSLVDRAEERAERFEGYQENRARDAERARVAVAAIADNIPLGQPILVGHHSERHARRDAERIRNGMTRAVRMWETSQYWERRAKGALAHAKYKELPGVRLRRIKGLEADKRRQQRRIEDSRLMLKLWRADGLTAANAQKIANVDRACGFGLWGRLDKGEATAEEAAAEAIPAHERIIANAERWIAHIDLRLVYERAMFGDIPEPTKRKRELPPIVNYPGDGFHHMTKAEWAKMHKDYKGTRVVAGCRVRTGVIHTNGSSGLLPVFLTDSKRVDPPSGEKPSAADVPRFKPIPSSTPDKHLPPVSPSRSRKETEPTVFDKMKEQLRTGGVQIAVADQLFPTPADLAARMVKMAGVEPGMRVLEPSAGTGVLVRAANMRGATVVAVETDGRLTSLLAQTGFAEVYGLNFLECQPVDDGSTGAIGTFDRIVMNPPFAGGADVEHVTHAWAFLKPGGRLVAVMSAGVRFRQDRKTSAFRILVDQHGTIEDLPDGTFKESGTGVRTVLVVLDKPSRSLQDASGAPPSSTPDPGAANAQACQPVAASYDTTTPVDDAFPKRCSCGRTYTREEWAVLEYCGIQDDEEELLELRTCPCGSTIGVLIGPSPKRTHGIVNEGKARELATITEEPRGSLADGSLAPKTWELRLPDGWRFAVDALHALVCETSSEARNLRRNEPIEPCPDDCACREDEET